MQIPKVFLEVKLVLILVFATFSYAALAQEVPPINIFSDSAYDAKNQNWSITQDSQKRIYVANNNGLLKFNGSNWHLYPSPNNTIIRSVNVIDDRIYSGCYMEFGFWEHNAFGLLEYTSLSDKIKDQLIEDEQFWTIIEVDDWILFQSLNRIYSYHKTDETFNIIESKTKLTKMFKVGDSIFFQKLYDGLYKIENGQAAPVNVDSPLRDNTIVNVFEHNNLFLIQTEEQGFYVLKDKKLEIWDISANELLNEVRVYSSTKLRDNRFAIGTISNGIIILKANGDIDTSINQSIGLSNNTVLSVFEDADRNIWVGLDQGINCINIESPFKIYIDKDGILGTVYTSLVFDGKLYLGTNQGLFYKPYNTSEKFQFIKGTKGQVWSLSKHEGSMFCGHNEGTFIIEDDRAKKIDVVPGTWNIKSNGNMLIQGNYDGLYVLEKQDEDWKISRKIEGFDISSKHFDFYNDTTLFINHEYKGVYKLKLNKELSRVVEVTNDSTINKGLNSSLVKYQDDILYAYKKGVFKYNSSQNKFVKDSIVSQLFDDESYITGKLVSDRTNGRLWGFSKNEISYISHGKLSNSLKINTIPLPHDIGKMMVGYENILHIENDKYLLGTSTGYIIIDLDKFERNEFNVSINGISNFALSSKKQLINRNETNEFDNKFNNIEIEYSAATYDKFSAPEYQYQLEGLYDSWSEWSSDSSVLFENLPYGNYTFNVKAKSGNNIAENQESFSFVIKKPWYLTNLMLIIYVLGFVLLSAAIHNFYKAYYKKQKQKLVDKNQRDLELKELENQQQLMQLKNEKLKQDIENKNRELAISTMSLIKKNEFLSSIKEELKNADINDQIKPVIKIIDKNLNNTDDWKFFQQAFNNADKDFLKKVKSKHPNLTPNDLKLCAYLRLNLSSKEIAPLLNISPRSVEVKRYRLRKKIDLPHESSLTNYILEI